MKRRQLIVALGYATAFVFPVRAKTDRLIGLLLTYNAGEPGAPGAQLRIKALREALEQRGWSQGQIIRIEERWAGSGSDTALLDASAAELVKLDFDVIVAQATPATTALLRLTHSIPVVFLAVSDPVGQGLVASIPRPGGNATGFTSFEFSVGSKWFELIKELAPGIRRLAAVFNPKTAPYAPRFIQSFDAAVRDFGAEIKPARIESVEEIEAVVRGVGGSDTGMVVMPDTFTTMHRQKIIDAAAKHRVVAIYPFSYMVRDGGLISYGVNVIDLFRQAASYVDRILRGTSPAELPVQEKTKLELFINLKTAAALGITVPQTLLARADEVID